MSTGPADHRLRTFRTPFRRIDAHDRASFRLPYRILESSERKRAHETDDLHRRRRLPETLAVARKNALPAVVAGNATQNLARHIRRGDPREPRDGFWVDTLPVGIGADAADFAIVQELEPGDIVVTQDIGLAAMALGRHARAIGVRGRVYTLTTIDLDMHIRHEEKKVRRQGGRTKGPAAFEDDDRERFAANLQRLVEETLRDGKREGFPTS